MTKLRSFVDFVVHGNMVPVVFCGDLNSKPGSLVHRYLDLQQQVPHTFRTEDELMQSLGCKRIDTTWEVRHWLLHELRCPFFFCSAYEDLTNLSQESYPFTNVTPQFCGVLDYVFFSFFMLRKKDIFPLPKSIEDLLEQHGSSCLPCRRWPSHHLVVGAHLVMRSPFLSCRSSFFYCHHCRPRFHQHVDEFDSFVSSWNPNVSSVA